MSLDLACRLSHRIAAVATVGAGPLRTLMWVGDLTVSKWSCPWGDRRGYVPILQIHGTADVVIPHEVALPTAQWWASQMGYTSSSSSETCGGSFSCVQRAWSHSSVLGNMPHPTHAYIRVNGGTHTWDMHGLNPKAACNGARCFGTTDKMLTFLFKYRLYQLRQLPPSPQPPTNLPPSPPPFPALPPWPPTLPGHACNQLSFDGSPEEDHLLAEASAEVRPSSHPDSS